MITAILINIALLGIYGILSFPITIIFNKAWEAIAQQFNLSLFGYWQMYFITWALLILKCQRYTDKS